MFDFVDEFVTAVLMVEGACFSSWLSQAALTEKPQALIDLQLLANAPEGDNLEVLVACRDAASRLSDLATRGGFEYLTILYCSTYEFACARIAALTGGASHV